MKHRTKTPITRLLISHNPRSSPISQFRVPNLFLFYTQLLPKPIMEHTGHKFVQTPVMPLRERRNGPS